MNLPARNGKDQHGNTVNRPLSAYQRILCSMPKKHSADGLTLTVYLYRDSARSVAKAAGQQNNRHS